MGNGNNITFTGGAVSGATSDLYSDSDTTVSVHIAAPLGEIVGQAGGYQHSNFTAENVNIGGFEGKILGFGLGLNSAYSREYDALTFSLDASVILGGTVTVITDSWNPLEWNVEVNGYATLSTGGNVGVAGVGVGASIELTIDEGSVDAAGNANFGLAGISANQSIATYGGIQAPVKTVEQLRAINSLDLASETMFDWQEAVQRRQQQEAADRNNDPRNDNDRSSGGRSDIDRAPSISNNGSIDRGDGMQNVSHGSGGGANSTVGPGSGGSGTEQNHSSPSSTGYSGRGNDDLDGPEAAGAGGSQPQDNSPTSNPHTRPIIIDLDGDGVDVSFGTNVSYDVDGDGFREQTAWAAASDGLLVVDLDADGNISADGGDGDIHLAEEVAFAAWAEAGATDLQALAEATDSDGNLIFDTNGDGILDSNDTVWNSMKVFQDLDQDGEVDEGELKTLDEWGISQINLAYDDGTGFAETDDNITVLGNRRHRKVCSLSSAKEEHFANLVGFSSSTPFFRVAEVQWALV